MKIKIISFCLFVLFIVGCSSSSKVEKSNVEEKIEEVVYKPTIEVGGDGFYSWLNAMPGIDAEPRLQLTGEITIPKSNKYDFATTQLKLIRVLQNNNPYFIIKPTIRDNKRETYDDKKEIIFSTITGLKLTPGFNTEEEIDVEFIFEDSGHKYTFRIYGESVERVE